MPAELPTQKKGGEDEKYKKRGAGRGGKPALQEEEDGVRKPYGQVPAPDFLLS